jgi:hypothetical protein
MSLANADPDDLAADWPCARTYRPAEVGAVDWILQFAVRA